MSERVEETILESTGPSRRRRWRGIRESIACQVKISRAFKSAVHVKRPTSVWITSSVAPSSILSIAVWPSRRIQANESRLRF